MVDKVDKVNDRSADDALELLHKVIFALKGHMHRALVDASPETTPLLAQMEGRCLGYFARHPGSTQNDLVQHTGRDKAQIARVVRNLRDADLLEQVPDPADRRTVRLRPTKEGDRIFRDVMKLRKRAGAQAFAGLDTKDLTAFMRVLERMRQNLE